MCFIAPRIQTNIWKEGAGLKEVTVRTRMITLRNEAEDGGSWLQGSRLGARASKGPPISRYALFVDEAPEIKPFRSYRTGDVQGKAAIAHNGNGE